MIVKLSSAKETVIRARFQGLGVQPGFWAGWWWWLESRPVGWRCSHLEGRVWALETSSLTCSLPDPAGVYRSAIDRTSSGHSFPSVVRSTLPASAIGPCLPARPARKPHPAEGKASSPRSGQMQSSRTPNTSHLRPSPSGTGSFLRLQGSGAPFVPLPFGVDFAIYLCSSGHYNKYFNYQS